MSRKDRLGFGRSEPIAGIRAYKNAVTIVASKVTVDQLRFLDGDTSGPGPRNQNRASLGPRSGDQRDL